jgi:hypothetical protein
MAWPSKSAYVNVRVLRTGEVGVTVFDYVAIGVLIVLIVWAVPYWFPPSKL